MNLQAKRSVFLSRKGDKNIGIGEQPRTKLFRKPGPKRWAYTPKPWWQRLRDAARQRFLRKGKSLSNDGSK